MSTFVVFMKKYKVGVGWRSLFTYVNVLKKILMQSKPQNRPFRRATSITYQSHISHYQ